MKKRSITLFASAVSIILLLASCDNRKDFLTDLNKDPDLKIRKYATDKAFSTIVIDSFKLENKKYDCEISYSDERNENVVMTSNYNQGSGSAQIFKNENRVSVLPTSDGLQDISVLATDQFGKTSSCTIKLTAFYNMLPLAFVNIVQTDLNTKYEVNIDASKSYDRDEKFGGKVVTYEYRVGSTYLVTTAFNNINYIFPAPGSYDVYVRVQDNDGAWSSTKTTTVKVN